MDFQTAELTCDTGQKLYDGVTNVRLKKCIKERKIKV